MGLMRRFGTDFGKIALVTRSFAKDANASR